MCSKHNGRFNYKTGAACSAPSSIDLRICPLKVGASNIFVQLS